MYLTDLQTVTVKNKYICIYIYFFNRILCDLHIAFYYMEMSV